MTTAAEVKAMVRPVLDRNPDLALVGRWLYLKPIHHFTRAIIIDRTSSKEHFNPRSAVLHLFEVHQSHYLSWGEELLNRRSRSPGLWSVSDTDVQFSLVEAIEEQALPSLRAMRTLEDFFEFVAGHRFWNQMFHWPDRKLIAAVARGKLEEAREISREKLPYWSEFHPDVDEEGRASYRRMRELCLRLAADDRPGLAQLLHEWEDQTVHTFKIAHLWEPTPFPFERLL